VKCTAKKAVRSRNSPNGRLNRARRNPLPLGSGGCQRRWFIEALAEPKAKEYS
jgi:hypothetical protein